MVGIQSSLGRGERNILLFDLNESREEFCRREKNGNVIVPSSCFPSYPQSLNGRVGVGVGSEIVWV